MVSRQIGCLFAMMIVPILFVVVFEVVNLCFSDALVEFVGEPFETLLIYGAMLSGLIAFVALGLGFHCPKCGKRLLDLPAGNLLKKGFLYQYKRIWGIMFGKTVTCLFCGWQDGDEMGGDGASDKENAESKS